MEWRESLHAKGVSVYTLSTHLHTLSITAVYTSTHSPYYRCGMVRDKEATLWCESRDKSLAKSLAPLDSVPLDVESLLQYRCVVLDRVCWTGLRYIHVLAHLAD